MRLAQRLFTGYVIVVAVLVLLVVVLSGERLEGWLERSEIARLEREARFVAAEWEAGGAGARDVDALANTAGRTLGHRVTLIDSTGRVIGDSEFDGLALAELQNHATRPEVVAARRTGVGWSRRPSPSKGDEELYVAVRSGTRVARVSMTTARLAAIVARARSDVLLSGLIALGAAALLSLAFARAVSRPVIELRDVARALAAGDLARRPALSAPGEVGELGDAVHRMAEQLASRLAALQADEALLAAVIESLHEGIIVVDGRRRVVRLNESGRKMLGIADPPPFSADRLPRESALRHALAAALAGEATPAAELTVAGHVVALTARPLQGAGAVLALFDLTATRRLEAVRRDFVANVSHELKTPLTVIGGFAETLVTDDLPPEQRAQFAEAIRANAERMRRIVDDLLDLSRIESGGWRPDPAPVDVRAVAEEVIGAVRRSRTATASRSGQVAQPSIEVAIHPEAPLVIADPTAVRQIISNLVDNAIRYTPADGTVEIFTRPDAGGTWIGVRDTGIGIAPEHLPRIFERFYRADAARSREAGGTGLGLAIVRHLVEAHGGRVHATSEPGRGTTVSAFFPTPSHPSAAPTVTRS